MRERPPSHRLKPAGAANADSAAVAIESARLFEENSRQREELQHAKEELERLNQALRERVEVQDRELVRAREALAQHREGMELKYSYDEIITQSPKMLEVCGYGYQTAKNSHETLELFCEAKKNGTPFDAVILDLTIPGEMGGRIVIQKLLEIDPSVKAIVVSGYSNDPVLSNFKEYGFQGRIPKPFRLNEVSDAIQQVLNK